MNRKSGDILLLVIGGLLLAYTAFRSVSILRGTLPQDAQILAYIGLAGLDGGLLGWTLYLRHSARGDVQRAVAMFMVVVELAGVSLTSIGDSLMHTAGAQMPEYILTAVVWGVPGIIALNIISITVVHLSDPGAQIENAKRQLADEVQRQVAEQLKENVAHLAGAVAPQAAAHQAQELLQAFKVGKNGNTSFQTLAVDGEQAQVVSMDDTQPLQAQAKRPKAKARAGGKNAR